MKVDAIDNYKLSGVKLIESYLSLRCYIEHRLAKKIFGDEERRAFNSMSIQVSLPPESGNIF